MYIQNTFIICIYLLIDFIELRMFGLCVQLVQWVFIGIVDTVADFRFNITAVHVYDNENPIWN